MKKIKKKWIGIIMAAVLFAAGAGVFVYHTKASADDTPVFMEYGKFNQGCVKLKSGSVDGEQEKILALYRRTLDGQPTPPIVKNAKYVLFAAYYTWDNMKSEYTSEPVKMGISQRIVKVVSEQKAKYISRENVEKDMILSKVLCEDGYYYYILQENPITFTE